MTPTQILGAVLLVIVSALVAYLQRRKDGPSQWLKDRQRETVLTVHAQSGSRVVPFPPSLPIVHQVGGKTWRIRKGGR